ncbi:phospholipase C, phosphocholine-specific [Luteolibacter ambystomatis]|uniref:phospholipase C n=1 Tax=Luteolibacter ambystomatis TaxID=2824561 RepID=A0A975PFP2_9BACT|nr:phospholipase C, phosphocholine-specific [Luteolibacter ambystomatis]QUE51717.1 phospholipase C, phosphocholine-specific [Luteolibacter ambystomatis]
MFSRRDFLKHAAMLSGGLGTLATIPPSILKALEIQPADGSTFLDAEHVVILMQENRSFDHAFGSLRGVRGFEDPRAITLPDGNPVFLQTDAKGDTYTPFCLNIHESKATWMRDLPHDRGSQVAAGNKGRHDRWLKAKKSSHQDYAGIPLTLGYYDRRDIPFYHAFADAFTICDQHFCSAQTCTTPNRLFLWTGTNRDPRDPNARVRLSNGQIDHATHADWTTFPERLEDLGVPWKIYQNELDLPTGFQGAEDPWLGNFGDNPMEYFSQYHVEFHPAHSAYLKRRAAVLKKKLDTQPAPDEDPEKAQAARDKAAKELAKIEEELVRCGPENFAKLTPREQSIHKRAFTTNTGDPQQRQLAKLKYREGQEDREVPVPAGDVLHQFRKDVDTGKLPTVSWLVAAQNFSDHPSAPWYGAWYVSEVLDILTRNPEVWKKTIFILTYDENDGYYDHVPPFTPPHPDIAGSGAASEGLDTRLEFDERGHPIGLGYRVPLVIASPWSRGGNVCSQVFDHTSVLQFLETFLGRKLSKPVHEPHISAWRRTVCGDLTSAFRPHNGAKDVHPLPLKRDQFVEEIHRAKFKEAPTTYRKLALEEIADVRANPNSSSFLPQQEPGGRPSRALPYELLAEGRLNRATGTFEITLEASDKSFGSKAAGAPFHVYTPKGYRPDDAASYTDAEFRYEQTRRWAYAVKAGDRVTGSWPVDAFEDSIYHLRTYGPNGFFREYRGDAVDPMVEVACEYGSHSVSHLLFTLSNRDTSKTASVTLTDTAYGMAPITRTLAPGETVQLPVDLATSARWYDLELTVEGAPKFVRRYAGRVETGEDSESDPQIGRRATATARREAPAGEQRRD